MEPQAANHIVTVKQSPDEVAAAAAETFVQLAEQAASNSGRFRVALSGGSTPRLLYKLLSSDQYRDRVEWGQIEFFFGDERWVPPTDKDSNYKLANDELFTKVPVRPENIHPMRTENVEPFESAIAYSNTLQQVFNVKPDEVPEFNLVFLGMGDDGHTASFFPGTPAIHEERRLVAAQYVDKLTTFRITLTPPVLNSARNVLFMVTGASKAPALQEVLQGAYNPDQYPSQLLRNSTGAVTWLVDQAAAANLQPES